MFSRVSLTARPFTRGIITVPRHHRRMTTGQTEKKPVKVLITGATGSIGYNLAFRIADGRMFGDDQPVILSLYGRDRPGAENELMGVSMELNDSWFPLLKGIERTTNLEKACEGVDFACLVGSAPRGPGMERGDLITLNGKIFRDQGIALDNFASPTCKTVVVGNPANTNALIAASHCKNIPPENFSALTRLDHNRCVFQIARKAGVQPSDVSHLCIWGNHSPTMYPDVRFCEVGNAPLSSIMSDQEWITEMMVKKVQQRGREIIDRRQQSSSASAAAATVDHMRDWVLGSYGWTSMAVMSDSAYGLEEGLIFSYPVITYNGRWNKVGGLPMDEYSNMMLQNTLNELRAERDVVRDLMGNF